MRLSISLNRCDGCGACVGSCPSHVLELRKMDREDYDKLSFFGKLKVSRRGDKKSFVKDGPACAGCGKCRENCHERAITVIR